MKRTLSLLLASLLVLSACGSDTPEAVETTKMGGGTTAADTEEDALTAPELPPLDMGGETVTILTHSWGTYEPLNIIDITAEEENGEPLNDATYRRMLAVGEKYNCVIEELNANNADQLLQTTVTAGDDAYAFAIIRSNKLTSLMTGGYLTDISEIPHLNPDAPYYDQGSRSAFAIGGSEYGLTGDLTMNLYYTTFCAYFNKQLMEDYKLGSIYDTIRDGGWTIDEMFRLGKNTAVDLDNNGISDNQDSYAFTYIYDDLEGLLNAGGFRYAELNRAGEIQIAYETETAMDMLLRLFDLLSDEAVSFNVHTRSPQANIDEVGMFMNRQAMFSLAGIYYAPQFRDMKDDFGIIPFPKFDEKQKEYLTPMFSVCIPITVVPRSNADLDAAGILIEEMSYLGRKDLYPAVFDTLLKGKIARDDDSIEMLDIIFGNTFYDPGLIFNFGDVRTGLRGMFFSTKENGFASFFESVRTMVQSEIDALMEAIK